MSDEILKRIDALAAKLGIAASHLWSVYVKQARIEAIECIGWGVMWLLISLAACFGARWLFKSDDEHEVGPFVLAILIAVAAFLIACAQFASTPGMLINPEFWAFKELTKQLMGAK